MKYLLFVFISLGFVGCKTKQQAQTANNPLSIAQQKLGNRVDSFPNSSGQYILYVQQQDIKYPTKIIGAIVIETNTGKVLTEESFSPGYIRWIDESSLELLNIPEMIKAGEDLSLYTKKIKISTPNRN
ncbi:MAG: hypothetical protein ACK5TU_18490 [Cyclobacteriaceae bacterium]|jgi:hypothetical protein